ncbi:hypothetical protein [Paraburkholderia youngii]|uniref:hypothetical protein n=1 Tax=Paraburkholderia youngii TaxID=2782701 RepID=UPI003D25D77D
MNLQQAKQADTPVWTPDDAKAAVNQGWDLVEIDQTGSRRQIQKYGDSNRFANDAQAIAFVERNAKAGDALAIKALALEYPRKFHLILENMEELGVDTATAKHLLERGMIYEKADDPESTDMYHIVDGHSWADVEKAAAEFQAQQLAQQRLYEGVWDHPFGPGSDSTLCEIVIDVANDKLVAARAKDGLTWAWLSREHLRDLADSLFNANNVSENPENHGFDPIDALPVWAVPEQTSAAAAVEVPEVRLWLAQVEERGMHGTIPSLFAQAAKPTEDEIFGRFRGECNVRKLRLVGLFNLSHVLSNDPESMQALEQYLRFAAAQSQGKRDDVGQKAPSIFDTMVPWGVNRSPIVLSN